MHECYWMQAWFVELHTCSMQTCWKPYRCGHGKHTWSMTPCYSSHTCLRMSAQCESPAVPGAADAEAGGEGRRRRACAREGPHAGTLYVRLHRCPPSRVWCCPRDAGFPHPCHAGALCARLHSCPPSMVWCCPHPCHQSPLRSLRLR